MKNTINIAIQQIYSKINTRTRKHLIKKFTDKVGLVYFGFVDQNLDDHRIVRGLTVSSSHQDNHYSVGSVNGYNITIVDRSDTVLYPDGAITKFNWLIMAFDLHTKLSIPHFFIGANNRDSKSYSALFSTFPNMEKVDLGTFEKYDTEFTSRFLLYARPAKSVEVERIFPANTARIFGAHFWPLSVEQHDNVLYIYADNMNVTPHLLDSMLKNGLWLAAELDLQAELV